MEKNRELQKFGFKSRRCYYFNDIVKIENVCFDNLLLDEKSYENTLIYEISYKALNGSKPLRIVR